MSFLGRLFLGTVDVPSPSDIVPRQGISFEEATGHIKIDLNSLNIPFTKTPIPWCPPTPPTRSMDPVFDKGHNNLFLKPADEQNHKILADWLERETKAGFANIIVYMNEQMYAVHRVKKVSYDKEGRYFKCKGDNNFFMDPGKVRDNHVKYISAGPIY